MFDCRLSSATVSAIGVFSSVFIVVFHFTAMLVYILQIYLCSVHLSYLDGDYNGISQTSLSMLSAQLLCMCDDP